MCLDCLRLDWNVIWWSLTAWQMAAGTYLIKWLTCLYQSKSFYEPQKRTKPTAYSWDIHQGNNRESVVCEFCFTCDCKLCKKIGISCHKCAVETVWNASHEPENIEGYVTVTKHWEVIYWLQSIWIPCSLPIDMLRYFTCTKDSGKQSSCVWLHIPYVYSAVLYRGLSKSQV